MFSAETFKPQPRGTEKARQNRQNRQLKKRGKTDSRSLRGRFSGLLGSFCRHLRAREIRAGVTPEKGSPPAAPHHLVPARNRQNRQLKKERKWGRRAMRGLNFRPHDSSS